MLLLCTCASSSFFRLLPIFFPVSSSCFENIAVCLRFFVPDVCACCSMIIKISFLKLPILSIFHPQNRYIRTMYNVPAVDRNYWLFIIVFIVIRDNTNLFNHCLYMMARAERFSFFFPDHFSARMDFFIPLDSTRDRTFFGGD